MSAQKEGDLVSAEVPAPDPALPHEAPGVPAVLEADHVPQLVAHEGAKLCGCGCASALEDPHFRAVVSKIMDLGPLPVGPGAVGHVHNVDLAPGLRAQISATIPPPPNGVGEGRLQYGGPVIGPPPPDGDGGKNLPLVYFPGQRDGWLADPRLIRRELPATPDPQQGKQEGDPHDPILEESGPDRKLDGGSGC